MNGESNKVSAPFDLTHQPEFASIENIANESKKLTQVTLFSTSLSITQIRLSFYACIKTHSNFQTLLNDFCQYKLVLFCLYSEFYLLNST